MVRDRTGEAVAATIPLASSLDPGLWAVGQAAAALHLGLQKALDGVATPEAAGRAPSHSMSAGWKYFQDTACFLRVPIHGPAVNNVE